MADAVSKEPQITMKPRRESDNLESCRENDYAARGDRGTLASAGRSTIPQERVKKSPEFR
jgi:hypothetical protein